MNFAEQAYHEYCEVSDVDYSEEGKTAFFSGAVCASKIWQQVVAQRSYSRYIEIVDVAMALRDRLDTYELEAYTAPGWKAYRIVNAGATSELHKAQYLAGVRYMNVMYERHLTAVTDVITTLATLKGVEGILSYNEVMEAVGEETAIGAYYATLPMCIYQKPVAVNLGLCAHAISIKLLVDTSMYEMCSYIAARTKASCRNN